MSIPQRPKLPLTMAVKRLSLLGVLCLVAAPKLPSRRSQRQATPRRRTAGALPGIRRIQASCNTYTTLPWKISISFVFFFHYCNALRTPTTILFTLLFLFNAQFTKVYQRIFIWDTACNVAHLLFYFYFILIAHSSCIFLFILLLPSIIHYVSIFNAASQFL